MPRVPLLVLSFLLATSLAAQTAQLVGATSGSTAGGDVVTISAPGLRYGCSIPHCPMATVDFGGTRITVNDPEGKTTFQVISPPHAAGAVSLSVQGPLQPAFPVTNAFTYVEPKQSPLTNYERVLVPLSIDPHRPIPGAAGSLWTTELFAYNDAPYRGNILYGNPDCGLDSPETCFLDIGLPSKSMVNISGAITARLPYALVFWLQTGIADPTTFSLRLHDISRETVDAGTEVHVVRESDLVARAQLLNVRIDKSSRAALRAYDMGTQPASVGIYIYGPNDTTPIASRGLDFSYPQDGYLAPARSGFVIIDDLARELPQLAAGTYRVEVETSNTPQKTMWALVSITNNETQRVTMVTPR